jgi:cytochrome c-type biogenesis protein CcmF
VIPELGHFALVLALAVVLLAQSVLPLVGSFRGQAAWVALARPAALVHAALLLLAYLLLTLAFIDNDFSVALAANHSNSALPLPYRVAAVWGNHEGSILLWALILSLWTVAVALFSRQLPALVVARVIGVMGLVSVGFLLFTLFTSNPFERLLPAAEDGRDLNPLLQDPGMVFHPPLLYMGYVGFSVAFAFAIAALISGRLDSTWARWSRPWTTVAWVFLTLGIALGSAWAYYELGWGGWWFWDPVENASFMPWLAGTALIHSLAVTEKRGGFKMWTVLLAILAFSLSLMGTFLVRSGVLTSVHAFATDPARGIFILAFLFIVIGGSLALFAWRGPRVGVGGLFDPLSREGMLLANNVLLMVAAAAVLLGTLYPLVLDALKLGKISVGPAYFNAVFVPLMVPALFLMGVGPIARWKKAALPELALQLRWAAAASFVAAMVAPFVLGKWTPLVGFFLFLALWILATSLYTLYQRVQGQPFALWGRRLAAQTGSWWGMVLAHAGVAVFIVGVTLVGGYQTEQDLRMEVGAAAKVGGYDFKLLGLREVRGPNYDAVRATFEVSKDGRRIDTLYPEKRVYRASRMPMTEVSIDRGVTRDLYVSMGEPLDGGTAWSVRLYVKPFVNWIWGGCVLMALGGALAVADRRYRVASRHHADRVLPSGAAAR